MLLLQSHPELTEEGVDYVYDPPSPPTLPPPLHLVLVIDATLDAPRMKVGMYAHVSLVNAGRMLTVHW